MVKVACGLGVGRQGLDIAGRASRRKQYDRGHGSEPGRSVLRPGGLPGQWESPATELRGCCCVSTARRGLSKVQTQYTKAAGQCGVSALDLKPSVFLASPLDAWLLRACSVALVDLHLAHLLYYPVIEDGRAVAGPLSATAKCQSGTAAWQAFQSNSAVCGGNRPAG